jgi:hypothetical protein
MRPPPKLKIYHPPSSYACGVKMECMYPRQALTALPHPSRPDNPCTMASLPAADDLKQRIKEIKGVVKCMCFHPSGTHLALGMESGELYVYEWPSLTVKMALRCAFAAEGAWRRRSQVVLACSPSLSPPALMACLSRAGPSGLSLPTQRREEAGGSCEGHGVQPGRRGNQRQRQPEHERPGGGARGGCGARRAHPRRHAGRRDHGASRLGKGGDGLQDGAREE